MRRPRVDLILELGLDGLDRDGWHAENCRRGVHDYQRFVGYLAGEAVSREIWSQKALSRNRYGYILAKSEFDSVTSEKKRQSIQAEMPFGTNLEFMSVMAAYKPQIHNIGKMVFVWFRAVQNVCYKNDVFKLLRAVQKV